MSDQPEDPFADLEPTKKKKSRPLWQQIAYNMMPLIFLAVAGAILMPFVQEMMNPEPRRLTPLPGQMRRVAPTVATQRSASPAPETPAPVQTTRADPALISAYGDGAINLAARDARRFAALGAEVTRCGTRDAAWVAVLREVVGPDVAGRYNSFDGKPEDAALLRRFVTEQYAAALASGATGQVQRDCADVPTVPEFRAADALVRSWRAARGE